MTFRVAGKFASEAQYNASLQNTGVVATANKQETKTTMNNTTALISVVLPSGIKLEGTYDQLTAATKALGADLASLLPPTEYYVSKSKGLVKIKEMQTDHLKNTVRIGYGDYIAQLQKEFSSGREFVNALASLTNVSKHPQLAAMLKELSGRV